MRKEDLESDLNRLKQLPKTEVHDVLRRSYDGLDEHEKDIFLHIACFFKGMHSECVEEILNAWW